MKKYILSVLIIFFYFTATFSQVAGDYQSKASGNWGDASSWQSYDGTSSSWIDAVSAPSGSSGTITIQSSHTITVTTALAINSLAKVLVNGYLKSSAAITATTSTPYSFTFNNESTYEHALAGGAIPMSTWNTGSTCLVTGITSTATCQGIMSKTFINFTWNCPVIIYKSEV